MRPLLLTLPVFDRMRAIDGWLSDNEADLLDRRRIARARGVLPPHVVVEVTSYCGRSPKVVAASCSLSPDGRAYAVDPREGEVGALDRRVICTLSTLERFRRNLAWARLDDVVVRVLQRSYEIEWERSVALRLVYGSHGYASVSRDFTHFEPWLVEGAHVAFHGYAAYYYAVRASSTSCSPPTASSASAWETA